MEKSSGASNRRIGGDIYRDLPGNHQEGVKPDAPASNALFVDYTIPEGQSWRHPDLEPVIWGDGNDIMYDMIPAHDGGHLLVGRSDSNASSIKSTNSKGKNDFWVIKTDLAGNKLWDVTIGGSGDDHCAGVIPTSDGNYLLFGSSDSPADGDKSQASHGEDDFWVVKIDQDGSKIWDKRYGGALKDKCHLAIQLGNGDFILGGYSHSGMDGEKSQLGMGLTDGCCSEIDENGNNGLGIVILWGG